MSGTEFAPEGKISEVINKGFKAFQTVSSIPVHKLLTFQEACKDWQEMFVAGILAELEQFRTLEKHIRDNTLTTEIAQELLAGVIAGRAEAAKRLAPLSQRLQALLKPAATETTTATQNTESTDNDKH